MDKVLIITDSKVSSLNQAEAIFYELENLTNNKMSIRNHIIKRKIYHVFPNIILYHILKLIFFFRKKRNSYEYNLIISCGRIAAPYSVIFKRNCDCKNIHILDPYLNYSEFDRVILPFHDSQKILEKNIIRCLGSLVNKKKILFSENEIKKNEKVLNLKNKKIISILIGGVGKSSKMCIKDLRPVFELINNLNKDFRVIYISSRRTPSIIKSFITKNKRYNDLYFTDQGYNPYWYVLKKTDLFFVTADSVSMTSEALSFGKPVIIIPIKKIKKKIKFFQEDLKKRGFTKNLEKKIFFWKNNPLNESKRIAKIIYRQFMVF